MSVLFLSKTQKLAATGLIAKHPFKDPVCPGKDLVPNAVGLKGLWTVHKFFVDKKREKFRYAVYHQHNDVWVLAGVFLGPASKAPAPKIYKDRSDPKVDLVLSKDEKDRNDISWKFITARFNISKLIIFKKRVGDDDYRGPAKDLSPEDVLSSLQHIADGGKYNIQMVVRQDVTKYNAVVGTYLVTLFMCQVKST